MVDEAKQEQDLEPTPYKHSNIKELDETETVETQDTDEATPTQTTSFLDSEKQTKQQEHDFKKRYDDLKSHYDRKVNEWKEKEKSLSEQAQPTYKAPKSPEELAMFKANGRHNVITLTSGGCTKDCTMFHVDDNDDNDYEEGVSLCRICFHAVHRYVNASSLEY